jgi:hypothetical protein
MNKQITELALKAKLGSAEFDNGIRYYVSTEESFERFAELIVAECVEQILTGVRTNPPQTEPPELVQTLVRRIQQHFGVKE